jgi:hypothetical protein
MCFIDGKAISRRLWVSDQPHFFVKNGFDDFFLQGLKLTIAKVFVKVFKHTI